MASWLLPVTRSWWSQLDMAIFYSLNGSLGYQPFWDWTCALSSTRLFDLLIAFIMFMMLTRKKLVDRFSEKNSYTPLTVFLSALVVLVAIRFLFTKLSIIMGWQHHSPSLVLDNAFRLSEHFPLLEHYIEVKDRSSRSFPGDHASIVFLWGFFMISFSSNRKYILIIGLCALFMLPRLIAGAHWFSDNFVGGLSISLISFAIAKYTPAGSIVIQTLERLLTLLRIKHWFFKTCHP